MTWTCSVCGEHVERWPGNWNRGRARWCPRCAPAAKRVREFLRRRGFVELGDGGGSWRGSGGTLLEERAVLDLSARARDEAEAEREAGGPRLSPWNVAEWHRDADALIASTPPESAEAARGVPSRVPPGPRRHATSSVPSRSRAGPDGTPRAVSVLPGPPAASSDGRETGSCSTCGRDDVAIMRVGREHRARLEKHVNANAKRCLGSGWPPARLTP